MGQNDLPSRDQPGGYDTPNSFEQFKAQFSAELEDMRARGKSPEELAEIKVDDLEPVFQDYYECEYIIAKAKKEIWTPEELIVQCKWLRDNLTRTREQKRSSELAYYRYLISKFQQPAYELEELCEKLGQRERDYIQEIIVKHFDAGILDDPEKRTPFSFEYTPTEAGLFAVQREGIAFHPNIPFGIFGGVSHETINELRQSRPIPFPYAPRGKKSDPLVIEVALLPLDFEILKNETALQTYRIIRAYAGTPEYPRPVPPTAHEYLQSKARKLQLAARQALAQELKTEEGGG